MNEYEFNEMKADNFANTELIIEYLEATISDEIVLSSFVRELKVLKFENNTVFIKLPTESSIKLIKESYFNQFKDAVRNVFENNNIEIVFFTSDMENTATIKTTTSRNLSNKYTLENYVESDFNTKVFRLINAVLKTPGEFSPVFIHSASGLGKTHLLHAIGNKFDQKGITCNYIESNKFTNDVVELSKKPGELNKFIDSFSKYDVLLFDDIQNLGGKNVTMKVVFSILNKHFEKEKQIILAADKSPDELSGYTDRLKTRFESGIIEEINKPNEDDIEKILKSKIRDMNLSPAKWEREAIKFLARNNTSSIRKLEGSIKKVKYYATSSQTSTIQYTSTVIKSIFKDLTQDEDEITPNTIIIKVAKYYKINKGDIIGKSRKQDIVMARHMTFYLLREILGLSYKEIGKTLRRDHSTVISGLKNIESKMEIDRTIKTAFSKVKKNIISYI